MDLDEVDLLEDRSGSWFTNGDNTYDPRIPRWHTGIPCDHCMRSLGLQIHEQVQAMRMFIDEYNWKKSDACRTNALYLIDEIELREKELLEEMTKQ